MKKFSLMLTMVLVAMLAQAAGPLKKAPAGQYYRHSDGQPVALSARQAPASLASQHLAKSRSARKAVASADDVAGTYLWEYQQSDTRSTDISTLELTSGSAYVTIAAGAEAGELTITGMFPYALTATLDATQGLITIGPQSGGNTQYGNYNVSGIFYFEGDDTNDAGWYTSDIIGAIGDDGVITLGDVWITRILVGGQYDGYELYPYWLPGSTLTPNDGPQLVQVPEGLTTDEYAMSYADYYGNDAFGSVQVGFDGTDVYVQGFCSYLKDAWVKGTLDGDIVTIPGNQYFGNYSGYDFFLMDSDALFTYDAEAGTLTADGLVFTYYSSYYADYYNSLVLKKVVEKAAVPANPAITALNNGDYGYYILFNVPTVDVDGNGLVSEKLSYVIYTDVEQDVNPLTFTPATHEYLTEDLTEIPFGFTENYDFYNGQIYLNDLYSRTWNKIGIKSIYRGGGEVNETEIQWYDIKDYAVVPEPSIYSFNFNSMEVATSSNTSSDGDITEALDITEGDVTLTISPKTDDSNTPNRFWATNNGPQLRVYSGTLTFKAAGDAPITQIDFSNNARWNEGNTADSGEFEGAVWTGEAQEVVVTIAGNTQLNSISVTLTPAVVEDVLVELPAGVEPEAWTIEGTYNNSYGGSPFQSATEVAFDGNDVYVKGLAYYFPDAWLKGTLDEATNVVTFPTGQFVGEDDYGTEYMIGTDDGETITDIRFVYNAAAQTLEQLTAYILENGDTRTEFSYYGYWTDVIYYAGEPVVEDPVEAPEGLATETYLFKGLAHEYSSEDGDELEYTDYRNQVEVGFDGDDVYIQGISTDFPELWVKATKNAGGQYVIPANQFMGTGALLFWTFDYYFTAVDAEGNLVDVVLDYDAETQTFSTDQLLALNESKRALNYYLLYQDVTITKIPEVALTPADPEVTNYVTDATYPRVNFSIPSTSVDGEDLLASKLAYQIFVMKGDVVEPLTLEAELYSRFDEDLTLIPYNFTDNYDVYAKGTTVYLNQDPDEIATWTNIGVQSVYSAAGEVNRSNIGWWIDGDPVGIANVGTEQRSAVFFDLQGRAANASSKGLVIMQQRADDGSVKTSKVVRK
ncbi:MAG: hypothetical protein IJV24_06105 [Prevotella sp.]|nr:hypothetical protein [Prevotella sp.]